MWGVARAMLSACLFVAWFDAHNAGLSPQTSDNLSRLRTKQEIIAGLIRSKSFHFTYGCCESLDAFYPAGISCDVFFEEVVRGRIAHAACSWWMMLD
jgi:hypothetical protein